MKNVSLNRVRHPGLWQPGEFGFNANSVSSSDPLLDAQLSGKGWCFEAIHQVAASQEQRMLSLLIPAIFTLMKQKRWIVLISPPKSVVKQLRNLPGFDANRLLVVHTKDDFDAGWAMEGAIRNRNAAAIFAWVEQIEQRDIKRLRLAARQADSLNVLFDCGCDEEALYIHGSAGVSNRLQLNSLRQREKTTLLTRLH